MEKIRIREPENITDPQHWPDFMEGPAPHPPPTHTLLKGSLNYGCFRVVFA